MAEVPAPVGICRAHGKLRQIEFLIRSPETGEWICKEDTVCKISLKPNKKEKKALRLLMEAESQACTSQTPNSLSVEACVSRSPSTSPMLEPSARTNWRVRDETYTCPEIRVSPSPSENAIPLFSTDIITSWADEVDREFPLTDDPLPDNIVCDVLSTSSAPPSPMAQPLKLQHRTHDPNSTTGVVPLDLLIHIDRLENELCHTKRTLGRTEVELQRVQKNEKVLEAMVRNLCAELVFLRHSNSISPNACTINGGQGSSMSGGITPPSPPNFAIPLFTSSFYSDTPPYSQIPFLTRPSFSSNSGHYSPQGSARCSMDGSTYIDSARSYQRADSSASANYLTDNSALTPATSARGSHTSL